MNDVERDLRDMMHRTAEGAHHVPRANRRLVRRARLRRAQTASLVGAAAVVLVVGGLAGARSLSSDEALPPAKEGSDVSPFVDTWESTDYDGSTQTMVVRASGENDYEILIRDDAASVCSAAPSTITGTGRLDGPTELVIPSPKLTCDDGSDPKPLSGPPLAEQLRNLTFVYAPGSDTITDSQGLSWNRALPPGEEGTRGRAFVDTWTTTDADGRTLSMVIRESGEDAYEVTLHDDPADISFFRENENGKYTPVVEDVCSGSPATITGTGQLSSSSELVFPSPQITCDDGSEPKLVDLSLEELLRNLTFEFDARTDTLTHSYPLDGGRSLVWQRADAENRSGDIRGWVAYGDKSGVWARDLTSPGDPSDRVLLTSTPGTPVAWSRDGSKLLVVRDGLFVVDPDGTDTRVTDAVDAGSLSPDGTKVLYAATRECWWREACETEDGNSTIYVVDSEGGSPQALLTSGTRSYPDDCGTHTCMRGSFETAFQRPQWSPDGTQIAYFDGMVDWGNTLRVMNSDGTDSRVVVENGETLGGGHVDGLAWSPDGSRLAFSIGQRLYVVGVDGSGFRLLAEEAGEPYWSPDGSYIAYTRPEDAGIAGGTLDVIRLDDLRVQHFGAGRSGPWTAELQW